MQNSHYLAESIGPVSLAIAAYMPVNGTTFRVMAGQIPDNCALGYFGYRPQSKFASRARRAANPDTTRFNGADR